MVREIKLDNNKVTIFTSIGVFEFDDWVEGLNWIKEKSVYLGENGYSYSIFGGYSEELGYISEFNIKKMFEELNKND